jgi:hypothetical protein
MEEILRELTDTELDAVGGGVAAVAAGVTTSGDFGGALTSAAAAGTSTQIVSREVGVPFSVISQTFGNPGAAVGVG